MTKNKEIIRKPILLNSDTVAVLHIFIRPNHLGDMWFADIEQHEEERHGLYEKAADQFIDQLEDTCNMAFMEALRDKLDKIVKEHYEMISGKRK